MNTEIMPDNEQLPGKLEPNFGSFSTADMWFTAGAIAAAVLVFDRYGILWTMLVPLAWYLSMTRQKSGRSYYLLGALIASTWIVRVRKGNVRQEGDPTTANQTGKRRVKKGSKDSSVIPFAATSVPADLEGETVGIMHRKGEHTDSFVIVSDGATIAGQSLAAQHDAYIRIADTVKQLVSARKGYSVGVSYVFRKDPIDMPSLKTDLASMLHPEVFVPSGLHIPEEQLTPEQARWRLISANWSLLQSEVIEPYGRKVWMATVVTIRREGVLAKAQSTGSINPKYIRRLPINKMVKTVISGLIGAGVTNPRALDKGEIHHFIRGAWDTETIGEYYDQMDEDPEAPYQLNFTGHWPHQEMKVTNQLSVTDGTYATVLRLTGNREQEWQGYWRELMGSIEAPHFSFALVGSAVRSSREVAFLERFTSLLQDVGDVIGINHKTMKMEKREAQYEKRMRDIFESEFSQSYSIVIALRAGSEEELNDQIDQVESLATQLGMSTARITLASHQYPALWSATTGINML